MFNVLIVDDEKFERDGIKYLLSRYTKGYECHCINTARGSS
ncbi:MAG: hypothetical protein K0Q73_7296 [Paenibacillus sp.]|jgi:YesN/AraC family two-component response regulator|nr:hypothetical protein [Paenibacillus sp.]